MIVRHIDDIRGTDREVHAPGNQWISRRMLVKE